ncbi:Putative CBS domain, chloride channel, voltage gated, chloride channel, core [Septoria linicola]|uniref:Chloride channel protein n=1 Tax=Septoria linicola TaxID=215465 RepID=A0A9Q9EJE1_9PEZI|nr:putative CBS domain, chloride channel, voltage gated, chloride channel, core [Septoria linicola]USW52082.1 Putative CBS domain, chloride channel, voltage gated, chloride channel, core [Septoria linicola]
MPKSVASHVSSSMDDDEDYDRSIDEQQAEAIRNAYRNAFASQQTQHQPSTTTAPDSRLDSPTARRFVSHQPSDVHMRGRHLQPPITESTGLLSSPDHVRHDYRTASTPGTPRYGFARAHSYVNSVRGSRRGSFARGLMKALNPNTSSDNRDQGPTSSKLRQKLYWDDRVWYDQFTSTDWVHDSIADAYRVKELRSRRDFRGRVGAFFDGAQGWLLVFLIGCVTAGFAYLIDVTEATIFDYKSGYCSTHWWYSKRMCCSATTSMCDSWIRWSGHASTSDESVLWAEYGGFVLWCVVLAVGGCLITLQTKTTISSAISLSTLDENLAAEHHDPAKSGTEGGIKSGYVSGYVSPTQRFQEAAQRPPVTYYPAAGSGVAEVRVILSGFVLHGYLGVRTLLCKTVGLVLSVGSGMSVGKEGPYVHIATCIGNIMTRFSSKYRNNDGKRREILSASAAAGVAVAFGAPIGGVLFSLEEVSYYFPPKTLFRTFFCCIAAALSLKALNPYGTGKIVLFEVRYLTDWRFFEIIVFAALGVLGGIMGALFIKASRFWAKTFRKLTFVKSYPVLEVFLVALVTGLVSYWNRYLRLPVAELLYELAAPCYSFSSSDSALCPTQEQIPSTIGYLLIAFLIKAILTTVTFGIKVPAGIYVPSMVVGGLLGRIVGHIVQLLVLNYPDLAFFSDCDSNGNPESCVVPGVYALVAAGATMCGVTRLSVTLAVILFELTGSLEHVLPFSLGVLIAKWTADALEPLSIYDLLTDMNAYPYLDHKVRPVFSTDLGDITSEPMPNRYIDISNSPFVPAKQLRFKLEYLHMAGELDGGLPILKDGVLAGLIPGPDLEFALDRIADEEEAMCRMDAHDQAIHHSERPSTGVTVDEDEHDSDTAREDITDTEEARSHQHGRPKSTSSIGQDQDPTDLTPYIDPSPVALDITSPLDLVFECFAKLGLRYICVLHEGKYAGMVHKKAFVRYVKAVQDEFRFGRPGEAHM